MEECLRNNILRFWTDKMQDTWHGGFYGRMQGDGTVIYDAPKGCILNARILWTFSAAYRVLGDQEYLDMATRAYDYLTSHFLDTEHGGAYWSVDSKGNPLETKKQIYAQGFVLYGMSEYYRAANIAETLDLCKKLYYTIEAKAWDTANGGYIEAAGQDWTAIEDMRLSDKDCNYPKSQNTHLHLLEAYTNLYRIWKDRNVANSLYNLIEIFTERIINPLTGHLDLFFDMDWTRGDEQIESYGHDIELSWLLQEAAEVLSDQDVTDRVMPVVSRVAKASEKGLNPDGSMIHEANLSRGSRDREYEWWVLAEAVVGFFNIGQYDKSMHIWQYIRQHLVDYTGGEWWWSCHADGTPDRTGDKAGFWKCPYHNGRMCLEIIERTKQHLQR